MRNQTVLVLTGLLVLVFALPGTSAMAQQSQKRSEVEFLPVGAPPEERDLRPWDPYDISLMLELGGQVVDVSENNDIYRSHLNYQDGLRLFNFDFRGKGREDAFFTDFFFQGGGWGGDPYQWVRFGASKNKWFDFRGHYRESEYFWAFPGFARNQHRNDQKRRLQSYDLTLFPKSRVRGRLGYTRNSSFGLALTTFDFSRDEFLLFEPIRQTFDEYRGGVEWKISAWNFFFLQSYRFFRNDRELFLPVAFDPGNSTTGETFLNDSQRFHPIRGKIPFSRLTIAGRPHKKLDVTARILYSDSEVDDTRFEVSNGRTFQGQDVEIVSRSLDVASRPNTVADGAVTWRPISKLTISEVMRFNQFSISGTGLADIETRDILSGVVTPSQEVLQNLIKFKSYFNRVEARYDFDRRLGVRVGYIFTHRDVELVHFEDGLLEAQEETELDTNTLVLGANFRPTRRFSLFVDWEHGEFDNVFTRLSAADIDRLRVRARWKLAEGVRVSGSYFLFDNTNPNPLINSDQENRGFSLDFQLTRFQRAYLNLGYSRNDVSTSTDVSFFANFAPQTGTSIYVANDNYAYIDFGGRLAGNLHADAGYRVSFITGTFPASDATGICDPFVTGSCVGLTGLAPLGINWGGLNYHQPHASLRYAFSDNLSWKAGWRWYGYNVKQGTLSDYKAHIVTGSLVLTF